MNAKIRLYGILLLLVWGITSCDHKDYKWDIFGEDFETPVLTDQNTIQFTIHPEEWLTLEIYGEGRMVIDWGDGKMTKVGYGEFYEAPSHRYIRGSYRVRVWCDELVLLNLGNGLIDISDLKLVDCPLLENLNISSCSGNTSLNLEYCPKLKYLTLLNFADLAAVDISQCPNLGSLLLSSNAEIEYLDLSHNYALRYLECPDCGLSSLSLEKNTELITLNCSRNKLTSLDLSNNKMLDDLECSDNLLSELDLVSLSTLSSVYCSGNKLTSIMISPYNNILSLYCPSNQLDTEALNTVFTHLQKWEIVRPGMPCPDITFYDNPGEQRCDVDILATKNWIIGEKENAF